MVAVATLIGGGLYFRSRSAAPLTEKDTVVLADLDNKTGDAVFDDALKQALADEGTGFLPTCCGLSSPCGLQGNSSAMECERRPARG